jgi:hypothetical protein
VALLHIVPGEGVLVNVGLGYTVTVTFCVLEHPFAETVYTYVTTTGAVELLTSVSLILPVPLPATLLLIVAIAARVHVNVDGLALNVLLVGVYENVVLLHIADGVSVLLRAGLGLTVTTTL